MEHQAVQQNLNIEDLSLTELDQLWEQAKQELKQRVTHENNKNSVNQQRTD